MNKKQAIFVWVKKIISQSIVGIIVAVVLTAIGLNKEALKYSVEGDNYQGPYVVNYMDYSVTENVFRVDAMHIASGVQVTAVSSDTVTALHSELEYPIKYYLKINNLTEEKLKKRVLY